VAVLRGWDLLSQGNWKLSADLSNHDKEAHLRVDTCGHLAARRLF
jgi:hypothetical protein